MKALSKISLVAAALAGALVCVAFPARATDLRNVLADYSVTSWSQKDGLPSGTIWALAQDREGYIWLGADFGLMRFDGVRFTAWEMLGHPRLPQASVQVLIVAKDGSLWAGYGGHGGVSRLRGGDIRTFDKADGLAEGPIASLIEDRAGTLWAVSGGSIFQFANDRWQAWHAVNEPTPGSVLSASIGITGDLFVIARSGTYRQRAGAHAFEQIDDSEDLRQGVTDDRAGHVWITDRFVGFRQLGQAPQKRAEPAENGKGIRLLADGRGNLWVATFGQGLWRVRADSANARPLVERATALTGLSNNVTYSLLEDREGNIWVGTNDGLNRLTPHKVTQIADLGLVTGLETTADGSVWASTADGVLQLSRTGSDWRTTQTFFRGYSARAMYADANSTLWVATDTGLWRIPARASVPVLASSALRRVATITADGHGGIWVNDLDRGLVRWNGGRADSVTLPDELKTYRLGQTYTDSKGRVWMSLSQAMLGVVGPDATCRVYGADEGLDVGTTRVVYEDRSGAIWAVGSRGVARLTSTGERFETLAQTHGFPANLTGMLEDETGALWFGSASGIVRLTRNDFDAAVSNHWSDVSYRIYDTSDGVAGTTGWIGLPSAVRTKDGRLWFLTVQGISVIDPSALHTAPAKGPVRIDDFVVNDRRFDAASGVLLPSNVTRLAIDYAVPDLTAPLRTRFRYRLDGFDKDWVDAGTRRQATYTNLPPRAYRFHLQATADDGAWSRPAAVWDFSIRPAFYQTTWFYALCALATAALMWGAWRLRLAQVRQQFTLLLGERVRLSREIHDTLLQSLVGVTLQLDQMANDLDDSPETIKGQFVRMRKQVEEYIREARQSIWNLRSSTLARLDLPTALRQAGERAADNAVAFDFSVSGDARRCASTVEEQVLRIGQEAVTNALRHARAHRISMELSYDDASLTLRVSDDGRGFDPRVLGNGHGNGNGHGEDRHWGIKSMKERAETVGGVFRISSGDGQGTMIETVVPALPQG